MLVIEESGIGEFSVKCKYSRDYVFRLKEVKPLGRYDKPSGKWYFPMSSLPSFEHYFRGEIVWKTPEWYLKGQPMPDLSKMYSFKNNITLPQLKINLYDYQIFGSKFLIDRLLDKGFAFCCDSVGLGDIVDFFN